MSGDNCTHRRGLRDWATALADQVERAVEGEGLNRDAVRIAVEKVREHATETADVRFTGPGVWAPCRVEVANHGEWEDAGCHIRTAFDATSFRDSLREAARIAEQRGGEVRLNPEAVKDILDRLVRTDTEPTP